MKAVLDIVLSRVKALRPCTTLSLLRLHVKWTWHKMHFCGDWSKKNLCIKKFTIIINPNSK